MDTTPCSQWSYASCAVDSKVCAVVLEALVRAGGKPAPHAFVLIREYAVKDDDEAVQHLFDLACRFPEYIQPEVVALARELLENINPNMREIAADAIWRIGLPHGSRARAQLQRLARDDQSEHVRKAAQEALERLGNRSPIDGPIY